MNPKNRKKNKNLCWLLFLLWVFEYAIDIPIIFAQDGPQVPENFQQYFVHYVEKQQSLWDIVLNSIGLSKQDVGRSFALIAGVSEYPQMPLGEQSLLPAAKDIQNLVQYLKEVELFDEIVVLENESMNTTNLRYFLQTYFRKRLETFDKSRFLFAYSGHGFTDGEDGYVLLSQGQNMSDKDNSLNHQEIRAWVNETIKKGYYVLVLINSCYSGAFISRTSFGNKVDYLPKQKGCHVITAGGTNELTWHDPRIGEGSIFFEKFFRGLNGEADIFPKRSDETSGDGIVTVNELFTYLKQTVQFETDERQNPQLGDLLKAGSVGGFFFLNRGYQVKQGFRTEGEPGKSFGMYITPTPTPQPINTLTPKPTFTPMLRPTHTPTPKPTVAPSFTPAPTMTPISSRPPIFKIGDNVRLKRSVEQKYMQDLPKKLKLEDVAIIVDLDSEGNVCIHYEHARDIWIAPEDLEKIP